MNPSELVATMLGVDSYLDRLFTHEIGDMGWGWQPQEIGLTCASLRLSINVWIVSVASD